MTALNVSGSTSEPIWQAEILDERSDTDRIRLDTLRSDPRIDTVDSLPWMRAELDRLVPAVQEELRSEPHRWIYYPWRRKVVSVLGPRSYRRLRLDRNRNKITPDEQERLGRRIIGVIGQSVGHSIAYTLAMEGLCARIRLADFDILELSNLNRVPATVLDIGLNKAAICARRIAELDPYVEVEIFDMGVTPDTMDEFLAELDLVIEECDSLDIKLSVREAARARRLPVVMETSDRGLLDVERFDLTPDRPIFHGMLGDLSAADMTGLSIHDKVPYVLRILETDQLSAVMAASMAEVDETLTTWPQLAEDVTLGAASVAAVSRRIGAGDELQSGRTRIDLQANLDRLGEPDRSGEAMLPPAAPIELGPYGVGGLSAILRAASLAPSGGNMQPWEFVADDSEVQIHLVRERTSTMDVAFRGSYVAIGAALANARIAAAAAGRLGAVKLFPSDAENHIVTMDLIEGAGGDRELAAELPAMLARCANRQHGKPEALPAELMAELQGLVEAEGATLRLLTTPEAIDQCAELLGESDRIRYLTPRLHSEMMSELRWPGQDRLDLGLDVRTLELGAADLAKLAVAKRPDVMAALAGWNGGRALGQPTRDSIRSSSAIAVVTVKGGTPVDYVRGGAAVERLWIRAQARGLGVQPVSPVFLFAQSPDDFTALGGTPYRGELTQLAHQIRSLSGVPHDEEFALILRLSHAPAPTARSQRLGLNSLLRNAAQGLGIEADG